MDSTINTTYDSGARRPFTLSTRNFFSIAFISIVIFLLSVYSLLYLEPYLFDLTLARWRYSGLIPVTLIYLVAFFVLWRSYDLISRHITIPSVFFLMVFGYYVYLGTVDYILQVINNAYFTYDESLASGYHYIGLSLICWIVGYLFGGAAINMLKLRKRSRAPLAPKYHLLWNRRRLYYLNLFWGVVGTVSFIIFFVFYIGGIPFLQGISPSVSDDLRIIIMGSAHNIEVVAVNTMTMALLYSGVYLSLHKRSFWIVAVVIAAVTAFFLWGARIYILLPFSIFFMLLARAKSYSLKKIVVMLMIVSVIGFIHGLARNRNFFDVDYTRRSTVEALGDLHTAPEFRDTLGVISNLDELGEAYQKSYYFKSIFLPALPGRLWSIVGLEKGEIHSFEGSGSAWVIAEVTRGSRWTGIRPGIMAQTLMTFGAAGVVILFFLFGLLFAYLDRSAVTRDKFSVGLLYIYMVAVLASYSIIVMTEGLFTKFWYFTYAFILVALISGKRVIKHERDDSSQSLDNNF